ncbi:MAG: nuclear transport factor 2 family protein [Sphingomonas sp.]|uniref:nuclear transport factor 2 family protein n=1 Tax=Sphingomonas sp. TaxID=28214 RepID=UPI003F81E3A8
MIALMLVAAAAATAAEAPRCRGIALDAAVAHYADTARAMNPRRTAQLYAADGVLVGPKGEPVTGPAEIESFLAGFGGYKLGEQVMTVDTASRDGTGWRTDGTFRQRGNDPKNVPFTAGGRFRAEWRCLKGGWRVQRMQTFAGG